MRRINNTKQFNDFLQRYGVKIVFVLFIQLWLCSAVKIMTGTLPYDCSDYTLFTDADRYAKIIIDGLFLMSIFLLFLSMIIGSKGNIILMYAVSIIGVVWVFFSAWLGVHCLPQIEIYAKLLNISRIMLPVLLVFVFARIGIFLFEKKRRHSK